MQTQLKHATLIFFHACFLAYLVSASPVHLVAQEAFPNGLEARAPKSVAELQQLQDRVQKVFAKVAPATVALSNGSGVVVSEDGYILTAAHVNREAGRRVKIIFSDGTRVWGKTLGNNHAADYGLVKITTEGKWPFVEMGKSNVNSRGEWCIAVGYPVTFSRGSKPAVRLGRILRHGSRSIMTDCIIMGGDSGGPLFNLDGKVIGIHSRVNDSINQNFHIPVDSYREAWDRLVKAEDWNHLKDRTASTRRRRGNRRRGDSEKARPDIAAEKKPAYLGVSRTQGNAEALVSAVKPGSAAERAGIRPGDVVLKFNDDDVSSFDHLVQLVATRKVGDRLYVLIKRGQQLMQLPLQLGSRD